MQVRMKTKNETKTKSGRAAPDMNIKKAKQARKKAKADAKNSEHRQEYISRIKANPEQLQRRVARQYARNWGTKERGYAKYASPYVQDFIKTNAYRRVRARPGEFLAFDEANDSTSKKRWQLMGSGLQCAAADKGKIPSVELSGRWMADQYATVASSPSMMASEQARNRQRVKCRGDIRQPGLRVCNYDAGKHGRPALGPAMPKEGVTPAKFRGYLQRVQNISNLACSFAMLWAPDELSAARALCEELSRNHGGTISFFYLMAAIGCDASCAVHVDDEDATIATMVATSYCEMAFPEYEVVVEMQAGDILTFWPQEIYHGLINNPVGRSHPVGRDDVATLVSLYFNQGQIDKIGKLIK
jgi:hypothetical protein